MEKVYSIIPARGGSKGVPGKNIKPLKGHPLIAYSIAAARLSKTIDRVIVSTDSAEIAEISMNYGAEVPFIRPAEFAKDNSSDRDFMVHAIQWFESNEKMIPEYWVHLRPTTPLRDSSLVDEAIGIIRKNKNATSLRSGHEATESPFKWFLADEKGFFVPFRSPEGKDYSNMPRQMCPKVYIPDGYVDILLSSVIAGGESIHGRNIHGYISPYCVEVDSQNDFDILEYALGRKSSPILDYLNNNYKGKE
ncbi:MAG: cytidylyltransferase [Lentisphaerae bacterium GWF2_49_21]|nr:MAG: cytidylyltransferase [Lentisphaerae bacterium GWF2_49_21]